LEDRRTGVRGAPRTVSERRAPIIPLFLVCRSGVRSAFALDGLRGAAQAPFGYQYALLDGRTARGFGGQGTRVGARAHLGEG
jgi:hypothetical protein